MHTGTHRLDKSEAMSLRLESEGVERGVAWSKGYVRLVAGGGVTADKVIPPLLSVVLDRRGRRYPELVHDMTIGMLLARTSGSRSGEPEWDIRWNSRRRAWRWRRRKGTVWIPGGRGKAGSSGCGRLDRYWML